MSRVTAPDTPDGRRETGLFIKRIVNLAERGLADMYDSEKNLFCFKVRRTENGTANEGESRRYTIISLLGVDQLHRRGVKTSIDVQRTLEALLERSGEIDNIGDLGLILWLTALSSPNWLDGVLIELDIFRALTRYRDANRRHTMGLAWFLSGLSHTALALEDVPSPLTTLASKVYDLMKGNYFGKGIFGHQSRSSLSGLIRGRIGNFADQVYPIYALSRYDEAFGCVEGLTIARECAETICRLQGPMGQWWWHYDSKTGRVKEKYPVYSVHQDSMAPMALFTVSERTGLDLTHYIHRGLKWLKGKNELGVDMVDDSRNVIWRSFYRKNYKMYLDRVTSGINVRTGTGRDNADLMLNYECYPYHLGWILYVFANRTMGTN